MRKLATSIRKSAALPEFARLRLTPAFLLASALAVALSAFSPERLAQIPERALRQDPALDNFLGTIVGTILDDFVGQHRPNPINLEKFFPADSVQPCGRSGLAIIPRVRVAPLRP